MKAKQSKIAKIIIFIIINVILLFVLYNIPVKNNSLLENLCIYKLILKKECFNCGMTRAFLSIVQGEYTNAINYNWRCIVVFPIVVLTYLYSWYKYIIKKDIKVNSGI